MNGQRIITRNCLLDSNNIGEEEYLKTTKVQKNLNTSYGK